MSGKRVNFVLIFFLIYATAVISQLIYLQILKHEYYLAQALGQQKTSDLQQGDRGGIFFKDLKPLVLNQISDYACASPGEIKNPEQAAEILSPILGLEKKSILDKFSQDDSLCQTIKKKLTEEEVSNIKNANLTGIHLKQETIRYHPYETLAAQVSGFLGGDGKGQYGVEGYYNALLTGEEWRVEKEKGPGGYIIKKDAASDSILPPKGADVILTLDYNIQLTAEKLLKKAEDELNAEAGEIIVMDPNSGKILALANSPVYDPNNYGKVSALEIFQNSSIQKIFEPGSVFKPITMAAGLDQGKITPQTTYIDPVTETIGGYTISNFNKRSYGQQTMTGVLEQSINTGAVFVERQIGHQTFLEYLEKFGFFEKTGIDLQGEIFSQNKELKKGYEVNFATASFGQGIGITSLQLIRAFSAIANGGKLLKPYIVEKVLENDKIMETQMEVQSPSVISSRTASQLKAMLVSVVENGFGKKARIPGYYIAGKTGTAQVPLSALGINQRGYSNKTIQSFIGFGPAFNPQFVILVKLYNPQAKTAEQSAVPLFQEMAKYIIDYWQIPPDNEIQK